MKDKQYDIFISYCRKDIEIVKAFKQEIMDTTMASCWMDLDGIESGSPKFTKIIIEAINTCPIFLFMLTEASQLSENALKELDFAYKKYREDGKKVVIVYIQPCLMNDELSFDYGKADTIDWQNPLQREKLICNLKEWTGYEEKVAKDVEDPFTKERLLAIRKEIEVIKAHIDDIDTVLITQEQQMMVLRNKKHCERVHLMKLADEEAVLMGKPHPIFCHADILEGHTRSIYDAAFSPDGKQIVSASEDKSIRIWDLMTGECLWVIKGHRDTVLSVSFSPDGKTILSASRNDVRIWDTETRECLKIIKGRNYAAFSPDGKHIVAGGHATSFFIIDAETGECIKEIGRYKGALWNVSFSPDGKNIIAPEYNAICIWDAKTGECVRAITEDNVRSAMFSPDGKKIVSASGDNIIRIWDAKTGESIRSLEGHEDAVWDASFSPDGKRILSTSLDKTVRIWDAKTGECIEKFGNIYPYRLIKRAIFSPNGVTILLIKSDNTIRISDL